MDLNQRVCDDDPRIPLLDKSPSPGSPRVPLLLTYTILITSLHTYSCPAPSTAASAAKPVARNATNNARHAAAANPPASSVATPCSCSGEDGRFRARGSGRVWGRGIWRNWVSCIPSIMIMMMMTLTALCLTRILPRRIHLHNQILRRIESPFVSETGRSVLVSLR